MLIFNRLAERTSANTDGAFYPPCSHLSAITRAQSYYQLSTTHSRTIHLARVRPWHR